MICWEILQKIAPKLTAPTVKPREHQTIDHRASPAIAHPHTHTNSDEDRERERKRARNSEPNPKILVNIDREPGRGLSQSHFGSLVSRSTERKQISSRRQSSYQQRQKKKSQPLISRAFFSECAAGDLSESASSRPRIFLAV